MSTTKTATTPHPRMNVYVAGPMRGRPGFNFPAFDAAEARLRAAGHSVFSPAANDRVGGFHPADMTGNEDLAALGFDLRKALYSDLTYITRTASAVCVLDGWEGSSGARAEVATAHALGLLVMTVGGFDTNVTDRAPYTIAPLTPPSGTVAAGPRLIGIGGALASGKDAVADRLVSHHGFVKVFMSDPLNQAMLALNPWVPWNMDKTPLGRQHDFTTYTHLVEAVGYTKAKENPWVRGLLQRLGTDVGRNMIGEDVWVDIAGRSIDVLLAQGKSVVITGIRFPNELGMISERGGSLVWISRPSVKPPKAAGAHASETSLDPTDFDVTVENLTTLEALYESADLLATDYGLL